MMWSKTKIVGVAKIINGYNCGLRWNCYLNPNDIKYFITGPKKKTHYRKS